MPISFLLRWPVCHRFVNTTVSACQKILAGLLEPLYVDLGVIDLKGNLLCSALGPRSLKGVRLQDPYILRVFETREFSVGEIQKDSSNGKTVIQFGFPITSSSGALQGVAFVVLDYSWIVRITAENHLPSEASSIFLMKTARYFSGTRKQSIHSEHKFLSVFPVVPRSFVGSKEISNLSAATESPVWLLIGNWIIG